ncbi:MAG TPA: cysteine dioxygenase family protein [Streptosporangiaceae bacterium]|nr:cysteine dioxygenase family protein [Streptosporangiaceae bacterium]
MTITARSTCPAASPTALASAVRAAVVGGGSPSGVAARVATALARHLPAPAQLLTGPQLAGDPAGYQTHRVHVEPDGSFSIAVMVWRPGQVTPIHDHVSWCVTGVLQGIEYEEIFGLGPGGSTLTELVRRENAPGTVAGFAPPGDIHRVRNSGDGIAVSMHVYGADLARLGSSIRRVYDLPVQRQLTGPR